MAEQGANYKERAGQASRTFHLVKEPEKIINFICEKISDQMGPSQPAFTIHIIVIQTGHPIKQDKELGCFGFAHI